MFYIPLSDSFGVLKKIREKYNVEVILFLLQFLFFKGEMPEWSIGAVSKTVVPLQVPRVRIPVSPQHKDTLSIYIDQTFLPLRRKSFTGFFELNT